MRYTSGSQGRSPISDAMPQPGRYRSFTSLALCMYRSYLICAACVLLYPLKPIFSGSRMRCATTWACTSASWEWRMWKAQCGRWTKWNTRAGDRRRSQGMAHQQTLFWEKQRGIMLCLKYNIKPLSRNVIGSIKMQLCYAESKVHIMWLLLHTCVLHLLCLSVYVTVVSI